MATALAVGMAKDASPGTAIAAYDPNEAAVQTFSDSITKFGVEFIQCRLNQEVIENCDCVFLAIKPQNIELALAEVQVSKGTVFVSVIAGTTIDRLAELLGTTEVIRAMPNTPCLIAKGAIALSSSTSVAAEKIEYVKSIFSRIGTVVTVAEKLMDAVTGLSGSGPAYVFTFIEALIEAGVLSGLSRSNARQLAVQTVIGAAELVEQTGKGPAELRDQVTSPGGTTIHGLEQLEQFGFRAAVSAAVKAATNRSIELGKN